MKNVHEMVKEFLKIRLLMGHDWDRICLRHEWEFICKDAIKLDRLTLDRPISDGEDGWQCLLEDVIRFRHTPAYYEGLPLGYSQPDDVLRREDSKGKPPRVRSRPRGLEKVVLWLHRNSMSRNESIIYNTQTAVAANFYTKLENLT